VRLLLLVFAAAAADLDLVLRFVDGRNHHQGASHSIGAAVIAGVAGAVLARIAGWPRPAALGLAAGAAWLSHVALDFVGSDTHPPIGLMALWPFDGSYHKSPFILFMDVGRSLTWETARNNAWAALREAAILGPVLAACWWLRRRD
jgi:membrane-bound metal-dependent hydrolase YbcI (DUF457 family)